MGWEHGSWSPILEGAEAARALEAIDAIAEALRDSESSQVQGPALEDGQTGVALFFSHRALAEDSDTDAETALAYLERALAGGIDDLQNPSLYGGIAGVAWLVQNLRDVLLEPEEVEEICQVVDRMLINLLRETPWKRGYDLIFGLVGFGVYLLERLPDPQAMVGLERIVAHLDELAEQTDEGVTWFTSAEDLSGQEREQTPEGCYNLGLPHGVPGCIGLLAQLRAQGIAVDQTEPLLRGAVSWLLAQRQPEAIGSCFPPWTGPGVESLRSRVAWCYGDLGPAVALLLAARCSNVAAWEQEAVAIATHASRRSDDTGVVDVGLCHGAAGVGHVFNRLYQATGDLELKEAARYWLTHTVDRLRPGEGVGGVLSWSPDQGVMKWRADPTFLTGAAGVGLALLSAMRALKPTWDWLLLTAVP